MNLLIYIILKRFLYNLKINKMGVVCNECRACLEQGNRRNNQGNSSGQQHPRGQGPHGGISKSQGYSGNSGSGSKCYSCSAVINQRPEQGRNDFRIQINAQHNGDHSCDQQELTMIFNYPVTFKSCSNGSLSSSNNTTRIKVTLRYHNNQKDNIGMGDFIVESAHHDLQIVNCFINDGH